MTIKRILLWLITHLWRWFVADKTLYQRVKVALGLLGVGQWVRQDRYDLLVVTVVEAIEEMEAEEEEI